MSDDSRRSEETRSVRNQHRMQRVSASTNSKLDEIDHDHYNSNDRRFRNNKSRVQLYTNRNNQEVRSHSDNVRGTYSGAHQHEYFFRGSAAEYSSRSYASHDSTINRHDNIPLREINISKEQSFSHGSDRYPASEQFTTDLNPNRHHKQQRNNNYPSSRKAPEETGGNMLLRVPDPAGNNVRAHALPLFKMKKPNSSFFRLNSPELESSETHQHLQENDRESNTAWNGDTTDSFAIERDEPSHEEQPNDDVDSEDSDFDNSIYQAEIPEDQIQNQHDDEDSEDYDLDDEEAEDEQLRQLEDDMVLEDDPPEMQTNTDALEHEFVEQSVRVLMKLILQYAPSRRDTWKKAVYRLYSWWTIRYIPIEQQNPTEKGVFSKISETLSMFEQYMQMVEAEGEEMLETPPLDYSRTTVDYIGQVYNLYHEGKLGALLNSQEEEAHRYSDNEKVHSDDDKETQSDSEREDEGSHEGHQEEKPQNQERDNLPTINEAPGSGNVPDEDDQPDPLAISIDKRENTDGKVLDQHAVEVEGGYEGAITEETRLSIDLAPTATPTLLAPTLSQNSPISSRIRARSKPANALKTTPRRQKSPPQNTPQPATLPSSLESVSATTPMSAQVPKVDESLPDKILSELEEEPDDEQSELLPKGLQEPRQNHKYSPGSPPPLPPPLHQQQEKNGDEDEPATMSTSLLKPLEKAKKKPTTIVRGFFADTGKKPATSKVSGNGSSSRTFSSPPGKRRTATANQKESPHHRSASPGNRTDSPIVTPSNKPLHRSALKSNATPASIGKLNKNIRSSPRVTAVPATPGTESSAATAPPSLDRLKSTFTPLTSSLEQRASSVPRVTSTPLPSRAPLPKFKANSTSKGVNIPLFPEQNETASIAATTSSSPPPAISTSEQKPSNVSKTSTPRDASTTKSYSNGNKSHVNDSHSSSSKIDEYRSQSPFSPARAEDYTMLQEIAGGKARTWSQNIPDSKPREEPVSSEEEEGDVEAVGEDLGEDIQVILDTSDSEVVQVKEESMQDEEELQTNGRRHYLDNGSATSLIHPESVHQHETEPELATDSEDEEEDEELIKLMYQSKQPIDRQQSVEILGNVSPAREKNSSANENENEEESEEESEDERENKSNIQSQRQDHRENKRAAISDSEEEEEDREGANHDDEELGDENSQDYPHPPSDISRKRSYMESHAWERPPPKRRIRQTKVNHDNQEAENPNVLLGSLVNMVNGLREMISEQSSNYADQRKEAARERRQLVKMFERQGRQQKEDMEKLFRQQQDQMAKQWSWQQEQLAKQQEQWARRQEETEKRNVDLAKELSAKRSKRGGEHEDLMRMSLNVAQTVLGRLSK